MGRDFTAEEEKHRNENVVVIADSLWRRRFQSDPAIIGRKILLDGKPHVVIGVAPASFVFPGNPCGWAGARPSRSRSTSLSATNPAT